MRVMIVVTHLLGTGHLSRALTIGRAFTKAGDNVRIVSGGLPVGHFDNASGQILQLPPVRSDGVDFTRLLTETGTPAGPDCMAERQRMLCDALDEFRPDVVITELFPFGRRILRSEFIALLEAARSKFPRPLVLSSIRDILAPPSKQSKAEFAEQMITSFYDGVLVHSDPDVIALERSWPISEQLSKWLRYTGFVAPPQPQASGDPTNEIIVSAGGGNVGDGVFAEACKAAALTPLTQWRLLVGGEDSRREQFAHNAPPNAIIEAPRQDFRTLLARAAASVSMCGYNTALDVLQTGVPAVLVPFDDGGEVEQGLRADALASLPGICVVRQNTLDGALLARAVGEVIAAPSRVPRSNGMDGAERTVRIVHDLRRNNL